jgi:magnesium-transporting ATPase (P-type)
MSQVSNGALSMAALASARRAAWRQRSAGGLMILAGLVSLGTLFFPWTVYSHVGVSDCPTCGLNQNVPFDNYTHALANGASFANLALTALIYAGIPLAFVAVGVSLLFSRRPMRFQWRALLIFTAVFFLAAVYVLMIGFGLQHFGDPSVTGDMGAAEWVALAAPIAVVVAGIFLPRRGRTPL